MDERVKELRKILMQKKHHAYRKKLDRCLWKEFDEKGFSPLERMSERLKIVLEAESPVFLPGERIAYLRTISELPEIYSDEEKRQLFGENLWGVGNVCPDYAGTIAVGLEAQRERCVERMKIADEKQRLFLRCVIRSIDAVLELAARYKEEALRVGNQTVASLLEQVPAKGARTFHEALQFFRILHFTLWCEGENHNCIGRFDQFMYPYWKRDLEEGRLTEEEAFSLLEEFFTTFNRDHDLYPGIQQGDNGQSLMLGGCDREGNPVFNNLSSACLRASRELLMIDPKINLRVDSKTPLEVYCQGTQLTKVGLGFPQYANDDIVIDGLVKLGYSLEDARDYTVAACWEFIIPRWGMEIPNIDAFSYPKAVEACVEKLDSYSSFQELMEDVKLHMQGQVEELVDHANTAHIMPAPFISIMMDDCIGRAADISEGSRYNNYGLHGVGFATAVDSLASIRIHVFEKKDVEAARMMDAVREDFADQPELLHLLRYETPKFGDAEKVSDEIACELLSAYAECLSGKKNNRGGIYRPGTGSAMYYMWFGEKMEATPGGRRRGEPLETNYAPALYVRNKGPLSVIQSFTKPNLRRAINGGPLTMEFHDSVFRDEESIRKVASLVQAFVRMGGHQMQLNAVNRDILLDAQAHPENHQNLIVRVWGWSAYFVQLDKKYQDHVIARQEFTW
ncbi:MAG: pyruvate formate lyase family protein [Hydrogeniiclostridium sp.]